FCDGCTATTVLVIMRPFRPRHTGADQAAYTLTATVPELLQLDNAAAAIVAATTAPSAPGLRRC
ncbi:hypothetical protein, partial [Mycobacterium ulcerans]|uniref:hypothetical protein n=1 Tax=Mycobacterium ulcerans TaxID=1809 RepID=UPI001A8FBB9B